MKRCNSCSKDYGDEFEFCPECGMALAAAEKSGKQKKLLSWVCVLLAVVIAATFYEQIQLRNQQEAIIESQYERPSTSDIKINPNWTSYVKGDYIHIEGSVTNCSNKRIRYYEIGIQYLDNQGNVLDSDYTNGTDVGPGESQKFDDMHRNSFAYQQIHLYVKEVS